MPSPQGSNYDIVNYHLTDSQSELVIAKKEFEDKFTLFLNKYRKYSSVGTTLTSPIFNIQSFIK